MSRGPDGGLAKTVFELVPGVWWPAADEDKCRELGRAWAEVAACTRSVIGAAGGAAGSVIGGHSGAQIDSFAAYWRRMDDGGGQGYLPAVAAAADQIAQAAYQ